MAEANKNEKNLTIEEDELHKLFEEEIKKPYYDVFYLDNFKLPYEKLDVSAVIVTYNRCPYKPGTLKEDQNPLVWSIRTCLLQKPKIKEIIIADDLSDDYTEEIVKKYQKYSEDNNLVPIKYFKVTSRRGISAVRNFGAHQSSGKYIFFMDDDGFIAPYGIFGATYTFEKLGAEGLRVGAINLPTYGRRSMPRDALSKKDIGVIDFVRGEQKGNKDCFPTEFIKTKDSKEKFMDTELHILNPIQITNLNTVSLILKKAFEEVEGFPEHLKLRMEDREFGCRLFENGYQMYYQPDPKFHFVHGSYGLHINKGFEGEDWFKKIDKTISIKRAMQLCDDPRENTGTRINSRDFISDYILSFFCLIYDRNKKGAIRWIKIVYSEFVKEGKTRLFGNPFIPVPSEEERKKMWISAITTGLGVIRLKEKDALSKINSTIKTLQKENETPDDILNILEDL